MQNGGNGQLSRIFFRILMTLSPRDAMKGTWTTAGLVARVTKTKPASPWKAVGCSRTRGGNVACLPAFPLGLWDQKAVAIRSANLRHTPIRGPERNYALGPLASLAGVPTDGGIGPQGEAPEADHIKTVLSERNILTRITHPFIVTLKFVFQTPSKFYFGLGYAPGVSSAIACSAVVRG